MRKKKGAIEYYSATLILVVTCLFIVTNIRFKKIQIVNDFVSNGLLSANLASDIIDLDRFAESRVITIKNTEGAYNLFSKSLNENLEINKKVQNGEEKIIDNKINIDNYTIYNVEGKNVEVVQIKPVFSRYVVNDGVNRVKTPEGIVVSSTSVYSKVSYKVKNIIGTIDRANQCTTDITTINK